jgi:hypothetical protein
MLGPKLPPEEAKMLGFFCRHLLGLCVTYHFKNAPADQSETRFAAYAGTLINIRGMTFFLTAGHSIRQIEEALANPDVEIESAALADTFAWPRISDIPVPFVLKTARFAYLDEDGLDFGIMHLEPYYVRLLAANGTVAMDESRWIHQGNVRFDSHYFMLGLPEQYTSTVLPESGNAQVSPTLIPVRRLDTEPDDTEPTPYPRFVAQLPPLADLESVVGMSGGPIIGFRFGETETRYWIVALQSRWRPDLGVVFGCPLPLLASMATDLFDAAAA